MEQKRGDLEVSQKEADQARQIYNLATKNIVVSWIFYILSIITPIILIVIGAINRDNCPIKSQIPAWMIVMGVSGLMYASSKLSYDFLDKIRYKTTGIILFIYLKVVEFFSLSWLIVGAVWVYSVYPDVSYYQLSKNYCDRQAYQISFWHITITFIILGIILVLAIFGGLTICWRRFNLRQSVQK